MGTDVSDRTKEFQLRHCESATEPDLAALLGTPVATVHWRDTYDDVNKELRDQLWSLKSRLDQVDLAAYTAVRNRLFPLAVSGAGDSRHLGNRAGHKLSETMAVSGMWQHIMKSAKKKRAAGSDSSPNAVPERSLSGSNTNVVAAAETNNHRATAKRSRERSLPLVFVDLCGGPGAFSQEVFALSSTYNIKPHGFGMTLANVKGLDWYPHLIARRSFVVTYGLDGTGNIFDLGNHNALRSLLIPSNVQLVVADGGFDIPFSHTNFQEAISARILFGQWLCAVKILCEEGCFVLKMFDTFTPFTRSLLYLSTFLFDRVHVVKPRHSRVVNSERYLACLGFRPGPQLPTWLGHLEKILVTGFASDDVVPTLLPDELVRKDVLFFDALVAMNESIATDQCTALRLILAAEEMQGDKGAVGMDTDANAADVEGPATNAPQEEGTGR